MAKIGARELRAALASVMRDAGDTIVPGPGRGGAGDALAIHGVGGAMLGGLSGGMYGAATGADDDEILGDIGTGAAIGGGIGVGRVAAAGLGGGLRSLRSALAERAGPSARMGIDDAVGMEAGDVGRSSYRAPNSLTEDAYEQMGGGNRADIEDIISRVAPNLSPMQQRMLPQARGLDDIVEMLRRMGYGDDDIASMMGVSR